MGRDATERLLKVMSPVEKKLIQLKTKVQHLIQIYSLKNDWEHGPLDYLIHSYVFLEQYLAFIRRLIKKIEESDPPKISNVDVKIFQIMKTTLEIDQKFLLEKYNISLLDH